MTFEHLAVDAMTVLAQEGLADLGAIVETEEAIFDGVSIDPRRGDARDRETVILIHHSGIDWLTTRLPGPKFTTPVAIGAAGESMMANVSGRVFVAFAQAFATDPFSIPIFCREVLSATTAGPAFDTGARAGAACAHPRTKLPSARLDGCLATAIQGRVRPVRAQDHVRTRHDEWVKDATVELLLAWDQPQTSQGGYRSIWAARSSDGGRTWFGHRKVADTGLDVRNPFVLGVSDVETRVYYVQGGTQPLGEVRTGDGGGTWSAPKAVSIPPTVVGTPRPSFFQTGGSIYCFTSLGSGGNALGISRVP